MFTKSSYNSWWYKYLLTPVMNLIGNCHWQSLRALFNGGVYYDLKENDLDQIRAILKKDWCVILTRRKCHLSTYGIGILNFLLTGSSGYYRHCLANIETTENPVTDDKFEMIEATGIGTHISSFMQVFDCDGVCLMLPLKATADEWETIMTQVKTMVGRPYDLLFDLDDDSRVSCVEMLLQAAKETGLADKVFPKLLAIIKEEKNLTPDMFREAANGADPDFRVVYEIQN